MLKRLEYIGTMRLSKYTIDALEHKASIAQDSIDADDPETFEWKSVAASCTDAANTGTTESLAGNDAALNELENYLSCDMPNSERLAIRADLCRAGWYERFDPDTVSTRRPKTQTVDGVKFVVA